jgi:IclR family KDG regulon transcriptional repressor
MIDISRGLGISKSMTLKLLVTLVDAGYLRRNSETNLYSLNIKLFEIGSAVLNQVGRKNEIHELLKKLVGATGETAQLAILVDQEVLYLDKVDSPSALRMVTEIGKRRPAYCTGTGKAIMAWRNKETVDAIMLKGAQKFTEKTITEADKLDAELQKIREMGYAIDDEENEMGITCIGAPIKSLSGEVVSAISVSGPTSRMYDRIKEIAHEVVEIARLAGSIWSNEFWV